MHTCCLTFPLKIKSIADIIYQSIKTSFVAVMVLKEQYNKSILYLELKCLYLLVSCFVMFVVLQVSSKLCQVELKRTEIA